MISEESVLKSVGRLFGVPGGFDFEEAMDWLDQGYGNNAPFSWRRLVLFERPCMIPVSLWQQSKKDPLMEFLGTSAPFNVLAADSRTAGDKRLFVIIRVGGYDELEHWLLPKMRAMLVTTDSGEHLVSAPLTVFKK